MNPQPINGNAHSDGIVRFETNIPVDLALKFADGLPVEGRFGDQVLYTLIDGRKMYVAPVVSAKLNELNVQPGEPVRITKQQVREGRTNKVRWNVERLDAEPPRPAPQSVPAAAQPQPAKPIAVPPVASHGSIPKDTAADPNRPYQFAAAAMASALKGAIDALLWAQKYGDNKGLKLAFNEEDVRTMATTLFITLSRESGVQPWRSR